MGKQGDLTDLLAAARELRPETPDPRASVLGIAESLGIQVIIEASARHRHRGGQLFFGPPPKVSIYRRARRTVTRYLGPGDERLLSRYEKFTVAHEIGHWILARRFGVEPSVNRSSYKETYWMQENLVNAFAGALLVPDWYVRRCIRKFRDGKIITPFEIRDWANCVEISQDVMARELCRYLNTIGFMRLTLIKRKQDKRHVLKVDEVCAGSDLALPNRYKHILNERFRNTIMAKATGTSLLRGCSFDDRHIDNVYVSWREITPSSRLIPERGEVQPDIGSRGYWVAVSKESAHNVHEVGLL